MKKIALYLVLLVVLVVLLGITTAFFGGSSARLPVHAQAASCLSGETTCLSGWAWSSNVGWISFNSSDVGAGGGPYDVAMDTSGNLTGYAWSPNVGWLSFNPTDLSGCPAANGPVVDTGNGSVTGWIRALSGEGRTDGWDGCIELSGTNHETEDPTGSAGVSYDNATGHFNGYAWGGPVIGWLQFDATCNPQCPVTSNDLTLQVQDLGEGSNGTGIWTNSVIFTLPEGGGSVEVPVRWEVGNATSIKIASTTAGTGIPTDWGVSSGATQTSSGTSIASDGEDTVSFSTPGTKKLILSYKLGTDSSSKLVTIRVNAPTVVDPGNACYQPVHATLCDPNNSAESPTGIPDASSCNVDQCNFYCDAGFKLNSTKTACVKSSIEEI